MLWLQSSSLISINIRLTPLSHRTAANDADLSTSERNSLPDHLVITDVFLRLTGSLGVEWEAKALLPTQQLMNTLMILADIQLKGIHNS